MEGVERTPRAVLLCLLREREVDVPWCEGLCVSSLAKMVGEAFCGL